jgi:hypothetical protein
MASKREDEAGTQWQRQAPSRPSARPFSRRYPFAGSAARTVAFALECRDIQQGADMTQRIPENFSALDWSPLTIIGSAMPPRDPNDEDDEDEDREPDDEREPPVIREPDEDE